MNLSMSKNNHDYDDIFKTLKHSHKRLFISVINQTFNKSYPLDTIPTVLPTDSFLENPKTKKIEKRDADLLFNICGDTYLIECQSYEDGSMAIRYAVVYIKSNDKTSRKTKITFNFPNGKSIDYDYDNIILTEYTREQLIEFKLFPFIPYYIIRYEKEICQKGNIEPALNDLEYFREELKKLYQNNELSTEELLDIMNYINRIIKHITDGNEYEKRLVSIMGGNIEETPSHEIKRMENEKIALNLFKSGASYEIVRNSISADMINDTKLKELMELAVKSA